MKPRHVTEEIPQSPFTRRTAIGLGCAAVAYGTVRGLLELLCVSLENDSSVEETQLPAMASSEQK